MIISARIRYTFGHFRPFSGTPSAIFGHFPVQQSQAELCKDSQSLTEVYGSCEVMLNDASCNEVIQSKEVTSLGSVMSLINGQKAKGFEIFRAESGAGNELEKLLKNLTPAKLKALQALLNMD